MRVEVHDEGREYERHSRQRPASDVEVPSTREIRREERQDDETEVPREPRRLVAREPGSEASNLDRDSRSRR